MNVKATSTVATLLAASIVAIAAMVHGAGKFEWDWFYPWVLAPYVLLALIFCLPIRQSAARSVAGVVAAALVLAATAYLYVGAMWTPVSSTSALVFVFAPVYLFIGALASWLLLWMLIGLLSDKFRR